MTAFLYGHHHSLRVTALGPARARARLVGRCSIATRWFRILIPNLHAFRSSGRYRKGGSGRVEAYTQTNEWSEERKKNAKNLGFHAPRSSTGPNRCGWEDRACVFVLVLCFPFCSSSCPLRRRGVSVREHRSLSLDVTFSLFGAEDKPQPKSGS